MSVRIRLSRIGKKKAPFYRIVAVDKRVKRDGKYLDNLGTYNPLTGEIVQFHAEKLAEWLEKGAIPSDTVVRIQKQHARGEVGPKPKATPKKKVEAAPAEKAEITAEAPVKAEAKEAAPAEKAAEVKTEEAPKKEKTDDKAE